MNVQARLWKGFHFIPKINSVLPFGHIFYEMRMIVYRYKMHLAVYIHFINHRTLSTYIIFFPKIEFKTYLHHTHTHIYIYLSPVGYYSRPSDQLIPCTSIIMIGCQATRYRIQSRRFPYKMSGLSQGLGNILLRSTFSLQ